MPLGIELAMLEALAVVVMGIMLILIAGGFLLRDSDTASAALLAIAGMYALLWQEPALVGFAPDEFAHVGLAQAGFVFFLSAAIFLWAYWLFQEHVAALETATEDLGEALEIEKTLLDILSHDLRNPLTIAHTGLATLKRKGEVPPDRTAVIESSLLRAERIVEDSLVYSRLSSTGDLEPTPLDLREIAQEAVDALRPTAELRDVELVLEGPDHVPVEATPLIQHAIENLVDNAIDHSPAGEEVVIRLDRRSNTILIEVSDAGPGLDLSQRERLFERFEQGSEPADGGSGLGLSIVRRLVDAHGGSIDVRRSNMGGACVSIRLPISVHRRPTGTLPAADTYTDVSGGGAV